MSRSFTLIDRFRVVQLFAVMLAAVWSLSACPVTALAAPAALILAPSTSGNGEFDLNFESPQHCPGDSEDGYLWQTFITPRTSSPRSLIFVLGLPEGPAPTFGLRDTFGSWIRNRNPGLTDGRVIPPTQVAISGPAFRSLQPGEYWIGIACTRENNAGVTRVERYWALGVTVSGSQQNWTVSPLDADPTPSTSMTPVSSVVSGSPAPQPEVLPEDKDATVAPPKVLEATSGAIAGDLGAVSEGEFVDAAVLPSTDEGVALTSASNERGTSLMLGAAAVLLAGCAVLLAMRRGRARTRGAA